MGCDRGTRGECRSIRLHRPQGEQPVRKRIVEQGAGIDCDAATGADFDLLATEGLPRWIFGSGILYNRMRSLNATQDSDCGTPEKWLDAEVFGDGVSISGEFLDAAECRCIYLNLELSNVALIDINMPTPVVFRGAYFKSNY